MHRKSGTFRLNLHIYFGEDPENATANPDGGSIGKWVEKLKNRMEWLRWLQNTNTHSENDNDNSVRDRPLELENKQEPESASDSEQDERDNLCRE